MAMRTLGLVVLSLLLAGSAAKSTRAAPPLAEEWNAPAIAWRDLKTGVPEAVRSGKTVVLVFHASWCTACRTYRTVFRDPEVVEATRDFVMILVDVDAEKEANGAFSPDGTYVPRTIFLTPDGDVRTDLIGKTDPEHPHTIDIHKPDELLALLRKAKGGAGGSEDANTDQRAGLR